MPAIALLANVVRAEHRAGFLAPRHGHCARYAAAAEHEEESSIYSTFISIVNLLIFSNPAPTFGGSVRRSTTAAGNETILLISDRKAMCQVEAQFGG